MWCVVCAGWRHGGGGGRRGGLQPGPSVRRDGGGDGGEAGHGTERAQEPLPHHIPGYLYARKTFNNKIPIRF